MPTPEKKDTVQDAPASSADTGAARAPGAGEGDLPCDTDALRAELAALRDRHLRLQAEFENFRKRQQRDREEVHRHAKERLLREIPGVIDNLERALKHAGTPEATQESLAQGIDLVARQLHEILARFGAEPMKALGGAFDPHLHEAMARVPTAGEPPDGTVVEEFRRGWLIDGKVLRPALVAVAKQADGGGEPGA